MGNNIDPRGAEMCLIDLDSLKERLRSSVTNFRKRANRFQLEQLEEFLNQAHSQAMAALKGEFTGKIQHPELAWVKSALGEVEEDISECLGSEAVVHPDGTLLGAGKYELLDPNWSLALIQYLEYLENKAPFGVDPQVIPIDNTVNLALVGDWGTGYWRARDTPAYRVAEQVLARQPDYTIHLGDVYYAGTASEEPQHFVELWPKGRNDQFALNSNHEMYSGGLYYFGVALLELFQSQNGTSFFALKNDHWLIVGLDTAYHATNLYMDGSLGHDNPQTRFLAQLAEEARNKKVIALSHHQALSAKGDQELPLLGELKQALGRVPDYWYWGHLHNCMVYKETAQGLLGRCAGHGAVPYGNAFELAGVDTVVWYEAELAGDKACKERVFCGFVQLELDGPNLIESFIGEDGSVRWSNTNI